jgi:hypothetical protein
MLYTSRKADLFGLGKRLIILLFVTVLSLTTLEASAKTVSDPNHKGWTGKHPKLKQVQWKPISTKCKQCVKITAQYNQTVQELLSHRYWVKFWREVHKNREKGKADPFWPGKKDTDISEFEGKAVAANLELFELQRAQLELHKKAVLALEQQAQYLSKAVNQCERTACIDLKPAKQKKIKIGGDRTKGTYQPNIQAILKQHGIDWQGPYTTNCLPCRNYAEQLNALPGWVVRAHMELQRAELLLKYSEMIARSNEVKLSFLSYAHPDKTDYSDLPNKVERLKQQLQALKQLFTKLVGQLRQCELKYCPTSDSEPISICPEPVANLAITVGANNDVGSRANFKEKLKSKTAGLATKALTGLLGIGGGGGGKAKGPVTYKDPVKNKQKVRVRNKAEKRDIRVGGTFTPQGLLISADIKKAPGKGTFHTIYVQNSRGWRLVPIRLLMYEIWKNWKLNVSWTRDTFVDGELVKHEQGGWSESWRELIAKGQQIEYAEVPIWEQLGFNTAVSGARSMGALFEVTPEMLASGPINVVVHITDPKKDPVMTVPYVFQVSLGRKGKVVVEHVEQSLLAISGACPEKSEVTETATSSENDKEETAQVGSTTLIPTQPALTHLNSNQTAPQYCPENWLCLDGKTCPPISNCTIEIANESEPSEQPESTPNSTVPEAPDGQPPKSEDDNELSGIEDIVVSSSRLSGPSTLHSRPVEVTEIPDLSVASNKPATTYEYDSELSVSAELAYGSGSYLSGYDKLKYGAELTYDLEDVPIAYGEEVEEPPVVGIVLKNADRNWVPRDGNVAMVSAKMYVPHPSKANTWIPHDTVKRKMEITFIARSNEKGKAMNADLDAGPQDSPDLYFNTGDNNDLECRDDPTGQGHFGTCETKIEKNQHLFYIKSADYGAFSRLDVSCEACVPLTLVAGVYPEAFPSSLSWEVAVEELDREKRAVYVPVDNNRNQISDAYLPDTVDNPSASEDLEDTPIGNGVKGDGLSAYEEYRGFFGRFGDLSLHHRTDWNKKTLLIDNSNFMTLHLFEKASGLEVHQITEAQHKDRIVNFNSGHANVVDQHGILLRMSVSLDEGVAGRCFCDLDRPKSADRVMVLPSYRYRDTVAHELGHAVGMKHHGFVYWPPSEQSIRMMTSGLSDLLPGRVHSSPSLCGTKLPASFYVGTKGDQGSGNHQCIMKYELYHYVYEQDGGDYDCMPATTRTLFDDSPVGTGPNGHGRTAGDAASGRGNCKAQLWITSQ